jgi:hypothetical protein
MTDLEIIQKQLSQCTDRLDRATERLKEIAQQKQSLGFDLHLGDDQAKAAARTRLGQLRHELSSLAEERDTLSGAVAELKRRLLLAQSERADADALVHINRVNELLTTVQELAPKLDVCWGALVKGSAGGFRREPGLKNPPLLDKVGNLVVEITRELKALKLDRGVWLPGNFALMHIDDFRSELEKLAQTYRHGPPVRAHNFVELISNWSASVKAAMKQHDEQTDNARVAA